MDSVSKLWKSSQNYEKLTKLWKALKTMKSYQNYEKVSKQEEIDVFLLNLKKYITNLIGQEYWKNILWL